MSGAPYVRRRTDCLTVARRRSPSARSYTTGEIRALHDCRARVILGRLGLTTATTMGGLIHVLLVIAVAVVLLRVTGCRGLL
jgi:hypothetical protein